MSNRPLYSAFADAGDGIWRALREEPNFRIQLVAAVVAIALAVWLHFDLWRWIAVVLVIGIVLASELFNTCLEHVIDLIKPEAHPLARFAKHAGAGAVLVASLSAAVVGALLYLPALAAWFRGR